MASCSTYKNSHPRFIDEKQYESGFVEGRRFVTGRVEVLPIPGKKPVALIWRRFGSRLDADLPNESSAIPSLDVGAEYRVELLTRVYRDPDYVINDILRLTRKGIVVYDASVCRVHDVPMERVAEHGMSSCDAPKGFLVAREREFPNDGNAYHACGSGLRHPTWECPTCEGAFHAWHHKNGLRPDW